MRYQFIKAEKAQFPVSVLCRILRVSTSGYQVAQVLEWVGVFPNLPLFCQGSGRHTSH